MFLKECDNCDNAEERVFVDSWTGLELCNTCLAVVINDVTFSPYTEGDNLKKLLEA
ncbi:hypothetical protein SEA_PANAMAXUS_73 [Mycobacterium phage Panamaxus]|uniref:Uncharacterized protein n=1 Tax=Mycobacterium phage Veracruz TaxID=2530154 RepID=A0A481VSW4_9CAUD|nr:hypothetical protein KIP27_gp20 [Mycobacterium phage Veracruz]AIS73748.1 hypothetical protein PBI_QUINNKIRO_74 [Mycobacterium phage QuinnKiro]ALA11876.1 hypothetical protein SEA_TEXAGE_73 [Mycobacterium phage Texage]AOT24223.1 hypothetical protein SEA_TODACORO_75 [Mycobacterium phage Todacoro]AOT25576.1 hypothetical protein SEA_MARGO_75 [Mycobacterium phage Margo]AUX82370.1 hypothetical protein SEA_LAMBERT1_75 [Mycobacterium phage Lambert1]AVP42989.1 hypothetical protein SEA_PANAMAXUS_73 [